MLEQRADTHTHTLADTGVHMQLPCTCTDLVNLIIAHCPSWRLSWRRTLMFVV